jgi:class 3 adenylate cyclase/CHASE2 domain-containing sensor protein
LQRWLVPWLLITALASVVGILLGSTLQLPLSFDARLYDTGIVSQPSRPSDDIVIVGFTEQFFQKRHINLAPRDRIAQLIRTVAMGKPSAIGLDVWLDSWVDFPERPRNGVDAQLQQALLDTKKSGVPIFINQFSLDQDLDKTIATDTRSMTNNLNSHDLTLPFFANASSGVGGIAFKPDYDLVNRNLPLSSAKFPSLPLLVAQQHAASQKKPLDPALVQRINSEPVPIDFCAPPGTWNIVPADKVLEEPALAFLLQNKIVLIGATLPRSYDFVNSPYDYLLETQSTLTPGTKVEKRRLYGVEVLAQSTATILRGAPRYSADTDGARRNVALLAIVVAAAVTAAALGGVSWGTAVFLCSILATGALAVLTARAPIATLGFHYWKASPPILAALFALASSTAYRQITIGRELRRVRQAFAMHVGPEVLAEMGDNMPELGGTTRDVAVLFCDIEGFSALSETMRDDPELLLATLNEHFEPLVHALQKRRAYVDNYVGDLVMAVFGAPVSGNTLTADTRNAVWAAIDFIEIIKTRNKERRSKGEPPINVGIGIHCGPAVVGNIGAQERVHYTAIGDTVNLASRVESATRNYQTPLLVSEDVVNAFNAGIELLPADQHLVWEFIAETTVKNRVTPVRLYRPRV